MATQQDVRRIALSLPQASEAADHFGFGVLSRGKLRGFAWAWNERIEPKKPRVPNPEVLAVRVAGPGGEGGPAGGRSGEVLHRAALQRLSRRCSSGWRPSAPANSRSCSPTPGAARHPAPWPPGSAALRGRAPAGRQARAVSS
jgi:hypothetical protein